MSVYFSSHNYHILIQLEEDCSSGPSIVNINKQTYILKFKITLT